MPRKNFTIEQFISKLSEADVLLIEILLKKHSHSFRDLFSCTRVRNLGNVQGYIHSFRWKIVNTGTFDVKNLQRWPTCKLKKFIRVNPKVICKQDTVRHVRAFGVDFLQSAYDLVIQTAFNPDLAHAEIFFAHQLFKTCNEGFRVETFSLGILLLF